VTDALLGLLDGIQSRLWRIGVRFQWPCWLLGWAWDRQATPYEPAKEAGDG
jgi:hypothetical protein